MIKTREGEIAGGSPGLKHFLRVKEVSAATGLPISTIYEKMAADKFPKNFRLTPRIVAWLEDDIAEWQQARIAERDGEAE